MMGKEPCFLKKCGYFMSFQSVVTGQSEGGVYEQELLLFIGGIQFIKTI